MISLGKNRVDLIDCDRVTKFDLLLTNVFNYYLIGNVMLTVFEDSPTVIYTYMFENNTLDYLVDRDILFCRSNFLLNYFSFDPDNKFPSLYANINYLNLYETFTVGNFTYSYFKNNLILYNNTLSYQPSRSLINYFDETATYGYHIDCFQSTCTYLVFSKTKIGKNYLINFTNDNITNNIILNLPNGICYVLDYKFNKNINQGELFLLFIQNNQIVTESYILRDKIIIKNISFITTTEFQIEHISSISIGESNGLNYIIYTARSEISPNYKTYSYYKKYIGITRNSSNEITNIQKSTSIKKFGKQSLYIDQTKVLEIGISSIDSENITVSFWVYPLVSSGYLFNAGDIKISVSSIIWGDQTREIYIPLNNWSHIIMDNSGKIYINGILVVDDLPNYDFSQITTNWCIGGAINSDLISYGSFSKGYFDHFRIYTKTLTTDEINKLTYEPGCSSEYDPLQSGSLLTLFTFDDIYEYFKEIKIYRLNIQPIGLSLLLEEVELDGNIIFEDVSDNSQQIRIQIDFDPILNISVFDISNNNLYISTVINQSGSFKIKTKQIIPGVKNIITLPKYSYNEKYRKSCLISTTDHLIKTISMNKQDYFYYDLNSIPIQDNDVTYLYNLNDNLIEILRFNSNKKIYYFVQHSLFEDYGIREVGTDNNIVVYIYDYNKDDYKTIPITYIGNNIVFDDSNTNILNTTTNKVVSFQINNTTTDTIVIEYKI